MGPMRAAPALEQPASWEATYSAEGPGLQRYLCRLTRDDEEASDVLQECFARALARRSPSDPEGRRRWLYRTASNLVVSRIRRAQRWRLLRLEPASAPDVHEVDQVRRALRSIPADQAVTLVLRLHQGWSRAEIAQMQGIPEETVKSRLARGRANFAAAYRRLERGLRA